MYFSLNWPSSLAPPRTFWTGSAESVTPRPRAVDGINCIRPRAPAPETAFGLNFDSVSMTAAIRAGSMPYFVAACWMIGPKPPGTWRVVVAAGATVVLNSDIDCISTGRPDCWAYGRTVGTADPIAEPIECRRGAPATASWLRNAWFWALAWANACAKAFCGTLRVGVGFVPGGRMPGRLGPVEWRAGD